MPRIDIVSTDAVPEYLNNVSLDIFRMWREFALGHRHLNGRSIMHPTGRYAASISLHRYGSRVRTVRRGKEMFTRMVSHIAIIADERIAPEAAILESGHVGIDMLDHLRPGRLYPMHRGGAVPGSVSSIESGFPRASPGRRRVVQMWSQSRELSRTGEARTPRDKSHRKPSNTSGTGPAWWIPPMPKYEPAHLLAELYANAQGLDITVS